MVVCAVDRSGDIICREEGAQVHRVRGSIGQEHSSGAHYTQGLIGQDRTCGQIDLSD